MCAWLCEPQVSLDTIRLQGEDRRLETVVIDVRALDSRQTAHPGLSLRDLDNIKRRAQELMDDVVRLRKTPLVDYGVAKGEIKPGDLLHGTAGSPFAFHDGSAPFRGLLLLPDLARRIGEQKLPEYTEVRINLHRYIREHTGRWQDKLFAELHSAILPGKTSSIKVYLWRRKHGLKG
jgi:hypothetical protein